ncbi:hypothetical protein FHL15_001595 [Xylaria flabelliformis]|uniref:C2H2-type domain-containing protein n=1 Tax=Xylaria flabelliformis TaxID=2512241 RepID=A0A553IAV7_9PEZI|nr:hypothetical protein FHL15_001595 [Xylaria flabelliformis]
MEFPTNLQIELKEDSPESFPVGTENVPRTTSESTSLHVQQPYTPLLSRSTPGLYSLPMEKNQPGCGTSGFFELTPPESAFGGYVGDFKHEHSHYLHTTDPRYLSSRYPLPIDPTLPSPLELPPVQYYSNNSTYDLSSLGWPVDESTRFIARQDVLLNEASLRSNPPLPLPMPIAYHARPNIEQVQQKSKVLQRVQQSRVTKRKGGASGEASRNAYGKAVTVIGAGLHKCVLPGCEMKRGFKRQEHLKRHIDTWNCRFCTSHDFNRFDNFRQHIGLHTRINGTGRTRFNALAQPFLFLLEASIKPRNNKKKAQRTQATSKAMLDEAWAALDTSLRISLLSALDEGVARELLALLEPGMSLEQWLPPLPRATMASIVAPIVL